MFGQIVAQRMQLRGHRAEHRGWPTRNRHMHFLAADINKGCTRIQHRQVTHSTPHVVHFGARPRQEPNRALRLQTSPTGSAMLAKMCNRQRSEPSSWPGKQVHQRIMRPHCSRRNPAGHDTVFMVGVQRPFRSWRLMVIAISLMTVVIRRHRETPMVAAASLSNFLGSLVSIPFAQSIGAVGERDLVILAMFGLLQVGLGLTLFALGSRFLPSGQASLIATLETPLMPFWVFVAFHEVPSPRALIGGALVMAAVIFDIMADNRARAAAALHDQAPI